MYNLDLASYNKALRMLVDREEKELELRKVSGYTIDELIKLFLSGAIEIKKNKSNITYTWCGDDDR